MHDFATTVHFVRLMPYSLPAPQRRVWISSLQMTRDCTPSKFLESSLSFRWIVYLFDHSRPV